MNWGRILWCGMFLTVTVFISLCHPPNMLLRPTSSPNWRKVTINNALSLSFMVLSDFDLIRNRINIGCILVHSHLPKVDMALLGWGLVLEKGGRNHHYWAGHEFAILWQLACHFFCRLCTNSAVRPLKKHFDYSGDHVVGGPAAC